MGTTFGTPGLFGPLPSIAMIRRNPSRSSDVAPVFGAAPNKGLLCVLSTPGRFSESGGTGRCAGASCAKRFRKRDARPVVAGLSKKTVEETVLPDSSTLGPSGAKRLSTSNIFDFSIFG